MSFPDQDEPSDSRRRRGRRRDKNDFDDFWGRDNGGTPGRGRKRGGEDADDLSDLADTGRGAPPAGPARRDAGGRPAPSPASRPGASGGPGAAGGPRSRPAERPPLTARPGPAPAPAPERPPVGPSPTRRPVGAQAAVPPHRRTGEFGLPADADDRSSRGRRGPGRPTTDSGRGAAIYDDPRAGAPRSGPRTRGGPERPVDAGRGGALPPDPRHPGDRTAAPGALSGAVPAGRGFRDPSASGRGAPSGPDHRRDRPIGPGGPSGPDYRRDRPLGPGAQADPGYLASSGGPADPDHRSGERRPAGPGRGRGERAAGVDRPTEAVDMSDLVFTGANEVPTFPDVSEPPTYAAGGPRPPWGDDPAPEGDDYDDDTYYDDYDDLDEAELEDLPKRRGCRNALIALAVLVVVGMVASWFAWSWVQGKIDPAGPPGEEVLVEIPEGTSTAGIGEVLAEAGVISDAGIWNWYTKLNDVGTIQAGSYVMRVDSSFDEAIDALADDPLPPNSSLVTIPEGLTQAQLAARLADPEDGVPGFTVEAVQAALNDPASRSPIIPAEQPLLEGTLFPETYAVEEGDTEAVVVRRMVDQFEQVATELDLNGRAAALGMSPYEVLIVASMVERESGTRADDPKVARVIYNRLVAGEALGIDATSCYPTGEIPCQVADAVGTDSPYDTRDRVGLPPTPIASPGRASIEAALAPAEGDWRWYVVDAEKNDGSSYFTNDYEDFLAAKERCADAGLGCG